MVHFVDNFIDTQFQEAAIANVVGVSGDAKYEDVSNSAEIEQKADQNINDCKGGSECENIIGLEQGSGQFQEASITNLVGVSGGDSYKDVSNSAEIEQKAEQKNKDCDSSLCENAIDFQSQEAAIANVVGGSGGDSYEDVSNSAEIEQKADQNINDCKGGSECENIIGLEQGSGQFQEAAIANFVGVSAGDSYKDVSNSAEIEQKQNRRIKTVIVQAVKTPLTFNHRKLLLLTLL
jgi:hypothetical protein